MRASRKLLSSARTTPPFNNAYGTPGRYANSGITATVFGAYGFVGRYFLSELGEIGSRAYVPFRGCELEIRHLKPMFDLGQLGLMPYSPLDEESIYKSLQNSDVVINLIGKHYETKHIIPTRRADGKISRVNYTFDDMHSNIPETIARLSKKAGVKAFIHVSALSASNPNSKSLWTQSKIKGEKAVREQFPEAIIVRPANIFGPEDKFLNYMAESMGTFFASLFTPIVNQGKSLTQPVYVNDVGKALMNITNNWREFEGRTFELVGPDEYSYEELYAYIADVTRLENNFVSIPREAAELAGLFLDNSVIHPFFTRDSVVQICEDCVASKPSQTDGKSSLLTLSDLGIEAQSIERVGYQQLYRFRKGGVFSRVRGYY